jgi:sarcosine oxidase subunit delta
MRLPCPCCGWRDEAEFRFGGDADVSRPGPPEAVSDAEWADYLFRHVQVAGWQAERWHHGHGCRRWFNLWRNTITHEVGAGALMGEPLPPRP